MYFSANAALYIYFLKCNHFGMTTITDFVKRVSIPDAELFSETAMGATASYFV